MKTNDFTTLREQVAAVTVYCFDVYLNGEHIERTFYNTKFPNVVKKDLVTKEGKVKEEPKVEPVVVEEKPSKEPFWWQLICIFILFPFVVAPFFCFCWVVSLLLRTGALFVGISVGGSIFNGGKK